MRKRILITGGSSKFVPRLLGLLPIEKFEVALLTLKSEPIQSESFEHHFKTDLSKEFDLGFKPEVVIHLAANIPYNKNSTGTKSRNEILTNNIFSTLNLLKFCLKKKVNKFIYISSTDVYPLYNESIINEETPVFPNSYYGCSKLACERIGLTFQNIYGLDLSILRLGPIYGAGTDESLFITKLINNIQQGKKIVLSTPKNILSLLSLEKAVQAFYKSIEAPSGVYNIAGEPLTIDDFAKKMLLEHGFEPDIEYLNEEVQNTKMIFDLSKAREYLSWEPFMDPFENRK